jgi:hypothetical protein
MCLGRNCRAACPLRHPRQERTNRSKPTTARGRDRPHKERGSHKSSSSKRDGSCRNYPPQRRVLTSSHAPLPLAIEPVAEAVLQDDVIMKAKLTIVILGASLIANGANAQHGTGGQTHVRHLSHPLEQTYASARREPPRYQSSGGIYESFSQGHQPYPNPDRELYVNRSCCS